MSEYHVRTLKCIRSVTREAVLQEVATEDVASDNYGVKEVRAIVSHEGVPAMPDGRTSLEPGGRELRLDFLRGVALLVVLVDHIEDQTVLKVVRPWMPVSTCYFDGAEAFVFLSGLVFGRAFLPRLEQKGLAACQVKAVRRAMSIYWTYLLTAWIVIGIGVCFRDFSSLLVNRLYLTEGAIRCALWSLPMCYQPWGFPILAVYTVILPFMPLLLLWRVRSPSTAWIIPLGLYIATQLIPEFRLPGFPFGREWTFNPFAWQFLFFIGMSVGTTRSAPRKIQKSTVRKDEVASACFREGETHDETAHGSIVFAQNPELGETTPERRSSRLKVGLILGSLAILVIGLLIRNDSTSWILGSKECQKSLIQFANRWNQKSRLGPVRIVHFMSLVVLLSMLLPVSYKKIWRSRLLAPVIKCGQNSLAVYTLGVILTFVSIVVFRLMGESPGTILIIEFDCCALSVGLAYLLEWYRRPRQTVFEKAPARTHLRLSQDA